MADIIFFSVAKDALGNPKRTVEKPVSRTLPSTIPTGSPHEENVIADKVVSTHDPAYHQGWYVVIMDYNQQGQINAAGETFKVWFELTTFNDLNDANNPLNGHSQVKKVIMGW